jgi:hypothetical protein
MRDDNGISFEMYDYGDSRRLFFTGRKGSMAHCALLGFSLLQGAFLCGVGVTGIWMGGCV